MKILFFGSDYFPTNGGIATYTREWLNVMAEEDIVGKAVIFGNKIPRTGNIGNNIELETLRSVGFFYTGFMIFLYFIRNIKYDYYYAFNLFPVGFWTVFWSKVFFKKSIVTFYGADACDTRTSKKVVFLQRFTITRSHFSLTISNFTKNRVIERYKIKNFDNIEVIYPILLKGDKIIDNKSDINRDDFIVVAVCRLVKRKGIEYLLEAISLIEDKNIRLIVIGDGPERNNLGNLKDKYNLFDSYIYW